MRTTGGTPPRVVVEVPSPQQMPSPAQEITPKLDLSPLEDFACPQCGGVVAVPRGVDRFDCSWCGSLLDPGGSLRFYRRYEEVHVSSTEAAQLFRAWLSSPVMPRDLASEVSFDLGQLQFFPFLRLKGEGEDRLLPMAEVPVPEVLDLARVPATLRESTAESGEIDDSPHPEVDRVRLAEALRRAQAEPYYEAVLEQRGYYVAVYDYRGQPYRALIDAAAGRVWSSRRPARLRSNREIPVSLGAAALLAAEALLIPGFLLASAAVLASALVLFFALRPWVRNG